MIKKNNSYGGDGTVDREDYSEFTENRQNEISLP